jgi:hypothetical protein
MQRIRELATAIALLFCLGPGCEKDKSSYCEEKIDCEHGTEDDLASCTDSLQSEKETADECGCSDLYIDWIDCLLEKGTCEQTGWHVSEDGTWEQDPDSPGVWVPDDSCVEIANTMHGCEFDAGLDPEHGGECGG